MEDERSVEHSEQGDAVTQSTGEDDPSSSPVKRGRGRPKGSVMVQQNEDVTNGGDETPKRGRGRPKLSDTKPAASSEETDSTTKKRGRPKGSTNKPRISVDASNGDLVNGSEEPKKGRGRPRKSTINSPALAGTPGKRGRPRKEVGVESNGISRGRGRPRKILGTNSKDGAQLVKRRRGRPKGSLNKKRVSASQTEVKNPNKTGKRGRPRNQPAKRGRPRKYPVSAAPKRNKNRVWKPLGRPRKYPREEPPEGSLADGEGAGQVVRRGRGRPRKSESKKGAHLRKKVTPATENAGPPRKRGRPPSTPKHEGEHEGATTNEDETPRKRGRPASAPKHEGDTANEDETPRKRGRPKSSVKLEDKESKDNGTPDNNCEDDSTAEVKEPNDGPEDPVEESVQG
ncbi:chromosomal protein D1 [Synchiropus splendidus]|uniref:chromosomal protein D1 n=1 Tax=Synchiropus splendidus TaxID=270530 RepID=UPI00237D3C87|nr:chromosomal protein D1 [Synchiropus splendidus]